MQIAADSGHIYIETRHPAYSHVKDFLISCCEPVSRTHHMQQYQLNSDSLSAASAEGTYSVDIIRTILQYFQLCGDSQQLPICLERYEALVRWADVEDDEDAEDVVERLRGLPFVAEMVRQHAEKSTASSFSSVKKNDEECAPRRTLKLSLQSNGPQVEADGLPTGSALLPLVALSRHDGDPTVAPPPLSSFIEGLLQEEEQSERVSLVLQPRLRRFLPLATSTASASSKPKSAGSGDETLGDELRYFLVSSSRPNLEQVVTVAKAYLQPILLGGTPRYIISDVDHGVEDSRAAPVEGTPRLLHRLFSPQLTLSSLMQEPSCAAASRKRPRAGEPLGREASNGWSKDVKKTRVVFKCEVQPGKLRHVRECLSKSLGLRTDCVYDYQQDPTLHVERLSLAPNVRLRPYQVASLERFRRGNKAHQGIVVLPCGAGKTLTGIGAASIMRKTTIVMCINNMSVYQWKREFLRWTNLTEDEVTVCTAREKAMPGKVFITTYNMVIAGRDGATGATAAMSKEILAAMMGTPWGLLLLDEVHVAFAHHFQEVLNKIQYKCVLGLSATLLREDDKIADSRHLVGPKLYEANWLELTAAGFLAKVVCAEVQCPMAPSFHNEYLRAKISDLGSPTAGDRRRRRPGGLNRTARIMASCNPYKLWCTQALLDFHRSRSPVDKILIFCDYLADVRFYAHHLHLPFMDQRTSDAERANLLQYFQYSDTVNALILTRVGDVALDLPCASVIIQISGLGASRRQEAQRLGRILRPKPPSLDNTCAYFYTLVSQDTHEVQVSYRRQSWLRDQGFAYRVLHASTVLAELQRVRGMPCCIGAPQWWWQVPAEESAPATKAAASSARPRTLSLRQPSSAYSHVTEAATGIRWAPFSPEASQRMHAAFMRGKDGVELRRDLLLGSDPAYAAMMDAREIPTGELSWKVQFSSVDIPLSNGTVQLPEELMGTSAARRIKLGRIDDGGVRHWCLSEGSSCSAYALSTLLKSDDMHGDGEDAAMAEALLGE